MTTPATPGTPGTPATPAMPIRPHIKTPKDGRSHRGLTDLEFVPYPDNDGRADHTTCDHPIFLDYVLSVSGICLECGAEHLLNGTLVPNGRILTDAELRTQRHRWHAIWGLDGWTYTTPNLEDAVPPARLRGQMSAPPARLQTH